MIHTFLNRQSFRSVLIFLDRTFFYPVMGCLFGCFRIRDEDRRHRRSPYLPPQEAAISGNRLSSLFLSEERADSQCEDKGSLCVGSPRIEKELRDEARFLKACGTIPETPTEIRKASMKLNHLFSNDESDSSKFHPFLPNTSIKKLQMDGKPDLIHTPVKVSEEWSKGSGYSDHTPSSCISHVQSLEDDGVSSVNEAFKIQNQDDDIVTAFSTLPHTTDGRGKIKSVRFEQNFDESFSGSTSGNNNQNSKKNDSVGNQSVTKRSPYPTPEKLSDEMQTPGTFCPAFVDNAANGKNGIRPQYVYSVRNPVENVSQWKVLKEEDSNSHQISGEMGEYHVQPDNATPKSEVLVKSSAGNELNAEASLSSWFKPLTSSQERATPRGRPLFGRTPGDRPIIGMVAAHWNEDEPTQISPKWWDGNGIPNSTNKYKEDQKVSWHATPFEERLEKALSEEGVTSKGRPLSGTPIVFDANEESDTALSQFQASTQQKSVVSF